MSKINAPRGTADTLPAEAWKWQAVERIARDLAATLITSRNPHPHLRAHELFHRGVGETTDIVHKETYTFADRGDRSITLRPEGTAGVVRAAIEHSLIAQEGARAKSSTSAPTSATSAPPPAASASTTSSALKRSASPNPSRTSSASCFRWISTAAAASKTSPCKSTASAIARASSATATCSVAFLTPKASQLSEDSQRRLTENPLRILDSKDPATSEAVQGAPPAVESPLRKAAPTSIASSAFSTGLNVPYRTNPNLVRGFDYYTETLWEVTASGLGAQNAIGGGGRYDNLVENLGGRPTPGVGFGSGLERLLIALEAQGAQPVQTSRPGRCRAGAHSR
jgi:histidyl-tRNA synthetase